MNNWIASIILLTCLLSSASAQTQLIGLGEYNQLNKNYYIGALYLEQPLADSSAILASQTEQKMVLKVTASSWGVRRFEKVWRQDIALNNDLTADPQLTQQLINFTHFPKEALVAGDEIIISFVPGKGSSVLFNGEVVVNYPGKSFFNALLNCWIGMVPYSQQFQKDILAADLTDNRVEGLVTRVNNLSIPSVRLNLFSRWKADEQAAKAKLAAAKRELELRRQKETEAKRLAEQKAAEEQARLEEERQQALALAELRRKEAEEAKKEQRSEEEVASALAAQKAAEEAARIVEQKRLAQLQQQQQQQQNQGQSQQYALDVYRWEVLKKVYDRISYPEWARQFGYEGAFNATIIIGSDGGLLGISSIVPEGNNLLIQELKSAINSAAPFKTFPLQLSQSKLEITIPYEFALSGVVTQLPKKPVPPAGVAAAQVLSGPQKVFVWNQYQDEIRTQIKTEIEYPFWAQNMKQEGAVVALITIQPDGTVTDVTLEKKTRHKILNQEVENAIQRLESFAAFPSGINESVLILTFEHDFNL